MASPLKQFEIQTIVPVSVGGMDVSITNATVFMVLAVAVPTLFLGIGIRRAAMVPGRWQAAVEMTYEFVAAIVRDSLGNDGRRYFTAIFTLFLFILCANMLGMVPYSFTVTSHIAVTFAMAAAIFVFVTALGIVLHGWHFFTRFVPPGTPVWLWPLIIPIELLSYFSRPISLSVRLFANMFAGHILLKVMAGFVVSMGIFLGIFPLALVLAFTGLEFLIAFLQAYVFTLLTCIYIQEAIHPH